MLYDGGGAAGGLPFWRRPLAVVAHPDDESFGLGGVLRTFAGDGADVSVLCLTRGEGSSLHGVPGDLHTLRVRELSAAAEVLGAAWVRLLGHPDGALSEVGLGTLVADIAHAVEDTSADGLVLFDRSGVTGHPDHAAATRAGLVAAAGAGLPTLEWTLPVDVADALNAELGATFHGHDRADIDVVVRVDRQRQLAAIAAHVSQAVAGSPLWRRLELLGDREYLRFADPVPDSSRDRDQRSGRGGVGR